MKNTGSGVPSLHTCYDTVLYPTAKAVGFPRRCPDGH